jgi:flavin reductase (DIM6/NTAB) family NADH-FMN oxidoreductase RutF
LRKRASARQVPCTFIGKHLRFSASDLEIVCRRLDTRLIGDHWLVVGEVTHALVLEDPRPPLLYHRGAFGGFDPLT